MFALIATTVARPATISCADSVHDLSVFDVGPSISLHASASQGLDSTAGLHRNASRRRWQGAWPALATLLLLLLPLPASAQEPVPPFDPGDPHVPGVHQPGLHQQWDSADELLRQLDQLEAEAKALEQGALQAASATAEAVPGSCEDCADSL